MSSIGTLEVKPIGDSNNQNSTRSGFIDLTLNDDSDSQVGSIVEEFSGWDTDLDEQPPTSTTLGSSNAGGKTTHPQSPKNSYNEDERSDDNDMKACLSLVRKRKQRHQPDGTGSPKRPRANTSSTSFSLEDCQSFFGRELKDASEFFAIYQSSVDQSKVGTRQALIASEDRAKVDNTRTNETEKKTNDNRKACEEEQVVSHPFLLNFVRCDGFNKQTGRHKQHHRSKSRKRTSRSHQSGQNLVSQPPICNSDNEKTAEDSRPHERLRVTNAPDLNSPKRGPNFAERSGTQQKKRPSLPPRRINEPLRGEDESSPIRTRRIDADRCGRSDSLFGTGPTAPRISSRQREVLELTPSMQSVSARTYGSASRKNVAGRINVSGRSPISAMPADEDDRTSFSRDHMRRRPAIRSSQPARKVVQRESRSLEPITRDEDLQSSNLSQPYRLQGAFGLERRPEEPPPYAKSVRKKWDQITQLNKPSTMKKAKRDMRQARLAGYAQQQSQLRQELRHTEAKEINDNRSEAQTRLLRAQQAQVSSAQNHSYSQFTLHKTSNDLTTTQGSLAATNGLRSQRESRTESRELEDMRRGRQRLPQSNDNQLMRQNQAPQAPPIVKISSTSSCSRPKPNRTTREDIAQAEAQFKALKAQHEPKRTTTLVNVLPADFRMAQPDYLSRARAVRNVGFREQDEERFQDRQIKAYRQRIRRDVQKKHANESEEAREALINKKFNTYLEKKITQRDRWKRGLLDVEFIEDVAGGGFNGEEVDLDARRIPASQVLEPTQTIVIYPVYLSKPYAKGMDYEDSLIRTKVFGTVNDANSYAKKLLERPFCLLPKRFEDKDRQIESSHERRQQGMLLGLVMLESGNMISVEVRKEQMLIGDLDPSVLHDKWVGKEVPEVYRSRYDVWYITRKPRAWEDAEKRDCKPQEGDEEKREETPAGEQQQEAEAREELSAANAQEPQGLEGSSLRAALSALPAPGSNPQPDPAGVDHEAEEHLRNSDSADRDESFRENAHDETSSQTSNDSTTSSSTSRTAGSPSPTNDSLSGEEEYHTLCASYTTLQLANREALSLARTAWKPRTPQLDAQTQWMHEVRDVIKWWKTEADLNNECVNMVLVPKFQGPVDRRAWGFVRAEITVTETILEGPRDLGVRFVLDHNPYKSTIIGRTAGSVEPPGDQDEADHIDLEGSDLEGDGNGYVVVQNGNDVDETETESEEE